MVTLVIPAVEAALALIVTVPCRYAPGSTTETEETVLSTVRLATVAEVAVLPTASVTMARKEYPPSGIVEVSTRQLYGAALTVHRVVQVLDPVGADWMT